MKSKVAVLAVVSMIVFLWGVRAGAEAPVQGQAAEQVNGGASPRSAGMIPFTEYLAVGFKTKYLTGSHTSYEFGNPDPPYQEPLSRLEFPLDSWWVGGQFRLSFPRFSIGVEALTNASSGAEGDLKDSDWEDGSRPNVKTVYSESKCHLSPSVMLATDIDLKVSDWLGLPAWLDLRPVAGFRYQDFNLIGHDGLQVYPGYNLPPTPLAGDWVNFQQTYRHYFGGARAAVDFGKPFKLRSLTATVQFDWGYVEGHNTDHHLQRQGLRYTYENTTGDVWHAAVGLQGSLYKQLYVTLEAEFLGLSTTGTHRWTESIGPVDQTWSNGVRAWSNQNSISMTLAYLF